jgi:4-hydroxy-tetrahydrodipicolinate synthase
MFQGVYTALVTPFKDNKFSEEEFITLLQKQIDAKVSGVVPCGTTGESPTLSHDEHNYIIELTSQYCKGKIQTLAGTGSNSTIEAINTTLHAQKSGADAALIVTPYYNKPSQNGLYEHFKAIHDNTDIPIILYNIPGRCVVNISTDLLIKLAKLPRIVAIKDATADLVLPSIVTKNIGGDFKQLSGEDASILPFYMAGGDGCISVTANIVPKLYVEIYNLWLKQDVLAAQKIQNKLVDLNQALFCETNPMPIKYAMQLLGLCSGELRLPLVNVGELAQKQIADSLHALNLL